MAHQKQVLYLAKVGAAIFFDHHPYIVAPIGATDKVYHNIMDFVNISSDTNITLSEAMAGETYSITVIAVNVLGDGYSNTTSG